MSQKCSLCQQEPGSQEFRVGVNCASRLGLRPLPPPRRPALPCTRCNGMQFVRVVPREYTAYGSSASLHQVAVPFTLTMRPQADRQTPWAVADPNVFDGLGVVEAFVCTGCGFIDWYCQDPRSMPIGHEFNTEFIDYASPTPYR